MDFIDPIVSLTKAIYNLAENAKANKERCQRIVQKVKALENLVLKLKQRAPGQISDHVMQTLQLLCITLNSARDLIYRYTQDSKGKMKSLVKSGSHGDKFNKMNEELSEALMVLSAVLHVEQGDMLCKMYESVQDYKSVSGEKLHEEQNPGQLVSTAKAPMTVSSPPASVPLPSTVAPMTAASRRVSMPLLSTAAPMTVSSPTASMPLLGPVAPMASSTVAPMTASSPTAFLPFHSPLAPMALHCPMPVASMPFTIPMAPMSPYGALAPMAFPSHVSMVPLPRPMAPMAHPSMMTAMPASGPEAPVPFQTPNAIYPNISSLRTDFP
ncbi:uncharacterized protein LOC142989820 [Genypterus blacodes]|uniref:uncharacterized protein LOC142989820 n=1 Tax=Genypterus blacodes TaxID=154954 RepID=UPI003F76CC53